MDNDNYKEISTVSRTFGMSRVWLHQLRTAGLVSTKVIKAPSGKQIVLYSLDDVKQWVETHETEYEERKKRGPYAKFTWNE